MQVSCPLRQTVSNSLKELVADLSLNKEICCLKCSVIPEHPKKPDFLTLFDTKFEMKLTFRSYGLRSYGWRCLFVVIYPGPRAV